MVEQYRFGLRKAFVPIDTDCAMHVARNKHRYFRIQIISHVPLDLPDFKLKRRRTGIIKLGKTIEEVIGSFDRTTRNNIHRADRDSGLRFQINTTVTDSGYDLFKRFLRVRGLTPYARSYYSGCVEFLAYADGVAVSGVWIFPSTPMGLLASVFSTRHEDCSAADYKRIGYASKRLMANVCGWGIEHGMSEIDMGGLNLDESEKAGIAHSKLAFGPIVTEQYVYSYSSPIFKVLERYMAKFRAGQRWLRKALRQ